MNQKKIASRMRSALLSLSLGITAVYSAPQRGCFRLVLNSLGSLIKMNTRTRDDDERASPERVGGVHFVQLGASQEAMIAPSPPIMLMIPLACERNFEGVMSGISATTGVRQMAMLSSRVLVQATKNRQDRCQWEGR